MATGLGAPCGDPISTLPVDPGSAAPPLASIVCNQPEADERVSVLCDCECGDASVGDKAAAAVEAAEEEGERVGDEDGGDEEADSARR